MVTGVLLGAMVLLWGCGGGTAPAGERITADDATIAARVRSALDAEPAAGTMFVRVQSAGGIVRLSGFANSRTDASRAVTIARSVAGVTEVRDEIVVRRGSAAD